MPKISDSLRKRYLLKLGGNIIGLFIGLVTQSIIPRALGPAAFGNFSFLTSFFWQIVGLLNLNSSTAFYTKLSQRQNEKKLAFFYLHLMVFIVIALGLFLILVYLSQRNEFIWPSLGWLLVIMGAMWALLNFCVMVFGEMCDAYGITGSAEIAKVVVKLFGLAAILLMFLMKWFSITSYFLYSLCILAITAGILIWIIQKNRMVFSGLSILGRKEFGQYVAEFGPFCMPLIVFSSVAMLEGILDRWFLQKFSGSVQQGYYGLAYLVSTLCFTFASAMTPLIAREYAISFAKGNIDELAKAYTRFVPMLYSLIAYFSCFFAVEAGNIMHIFGGSAYSNAVWPITIMAFLPIHQTYGQLNASVFFAMGNTQLYRNIGLLITGIGLPTTVLLLGPSKYGFLQAGASGLALKMVFLQIISVNIQLWFHAKKMNLSFRKHITHQFGVVALFLLVSLTSSFLIGSVIPNAHFMVKVLSTGILYTAVIGMIAIYFPGIFSLTRQEVSELIAVIRAKLTS
jgi:O-antigen/teichoic acid export membrane protein